MFFGSNRRYTLLKNTSSSPYPYSLSSLASLLSWTYLMPCLSIFGLITSFYLGRLSINQHASLSASESNGLPELHIAARTFTYQRIFGEVPSKESDHAWIHLFPARGGFFGHPMLAPHRSTFSVFHQLHCLNGIRQGYWALYKIAQSSNSSSTSFDEENLPMMASPPHIRHCIDLLRQTLMCNPDLTVEVKDESIGGVKGFGTEHQCYDFDQLVAWTRQWQEYGIADGDQPSSDQRHSHSHGHEH